MTESNRNTVAPATGKLAIFTPGLGAVATTFIAGVERVRRGLSAPIGSLTQMATIRLGKRTESRSPRIRDFVSLAGLDDIVFGAWDPIPDDAFTAATRAGVLEKADIDPIADFLKTIKPMPAVFENRYVTRIQGATNVKTGKNKRDLAEQIRADIRDVKSRRVRSRGVMVWAGRPRRTSRPDRSTRRSRRSRRPWRRTTTPSRPACCMRTRRSWKGCRIATVRRTCPPTSPRSPSSRTRKGVPISGKDFKTGQTWMKTIIAPGLKARMLGLEGWYSTNILGNRDGEVLDDPASFKTKEESKLSVLHTILQPEIYPELYKDFSHVVRINYYPPRGDNKEGWDNIDIKGWLGYQMQIKVNFLCRDSILAAPMVLDLALFSDFAKRAGMKGIQEWLSFYYKSPQAAPGLQPEHDLFIQQTKLKNTLRHLMGEEQITHLGLEYYQ